MAGSTAVVVGRSKIVGTPVAGDFSRADFAFLISAFSDLLYVVFLTISSFMFRAITIYLNRHF